MALDNSVIKLTAKEALRGNYLKVFTACFILCFTWILCINIAGLLSVITGIIIAEIISAALGILLTLPLALGVLRYIWRLIFGVGDNPLAVFYWFSNKQLYIRAVRFIFQFALRIIMWFVILNIPSMLLNLLSKSYIFDLLNTATPIWVGSFEYLSFILTNVSYALIFLIMLKYYMAPILFIADENVDHREAMYNSTVIARKTSIDFVGLIFSSFGWILLAFLVLPLPFVLPLLLSYYAVHTRFAVAEYNQHIENAKLNAEGFI